MVIGPKSYNIATKLQSRTLELLVLVQLGQASK